MAFYYVDEANGNQVVGRFEAPVPAKIDAGYTEVEAALSLPPDEVIYDGGAIVPKSGPTPAELLARAQTEARGLLIDTVNRFIERKPDGTYRYDTNLKLNLLNWMAKINAIEAAGAGATPEQQAWAAAAGPMIAAVETWMEAVMGVYLSDRKPAIDGAADVDGLAAVEISYDWFEARYGVAGSVLPDPDLYTADIMAAGQ